VRREPGRLTVPTVTLAHGGGGKAMRDLIDDVFVPRFDNPLLAPLDDQARLPLALLAARGDQLAFTTDSYVVDPLFFPGGDIGCLAVHGAVNDLAMSGAQPMYLSCAVIIEEGFEVASLRRIADSMQAAARNCGVQVVTGDTKVVPRGAADKLFITTTGIGVIPAGIALDTRSIRPGDRVLVSGPVGAHGAAILATRGDLALDTPIESDTQPLHGLVREMLASGGQIRCLRDATRGGLTAVVNEFAQAAAVGIRLAESAIPVLEPVRGVCEILGMDPLYFANEGVLVAVVAPQSAAIVLSAMRAHSAAARAADIGEVLETLPGIVLLGTGFGSDRILDMLVGEQLPRIC